MTLNVLVTGASGNVGAEVLRILRDKGLNAVAGLRDLKNVSGELSPAIKVDFEAAFTPDQDFDAVFLMRPPQLTDARLFERFLSVFPRKTRVVFLSVQGAEVKSYLPHAKIEKRIRAMGFAHVFVRPGYFMDNLTTSLLAEIQRNSRIYLPAGKLELDWVSARDVAEICANALIGKVQAESVNAISDQRFGFAEICQRVNQTLGTEIRYEPASLFGYIVHGRKAAKPWSFILVMLLLHYLPRFGRGQPRAVGDISGILERPAESIETFASRKAALLVRG